jgi:hypothetical protein
VLTDVFWPDPETNVEDLSKLDDIIKSVRTYFNSVVPIVVLTGKQEACNEALEHNDEVYDIWSKTSVYPEFFIYRIEKVIERLENKLGEEVLLRAVLSVCEGNPEAWKSDEIKKFIVQYQAATGLGDMLVKIKELFKDLTYDAGLKSLYVNNTFTTFAEMEPMDLARKSDAWGHLRHSLSVFLAGYVLLNSPNSIFDKDKIVHDLCLSDWDSVNKVWCIACTFHDTKVFEVHIPEILVKIAKIRLRRLESTFSSANVKIDKRRMRYLKGDYKIAKSILSKRGRTDLYDVLKEYMKTDIDSVLDHGILASIDLIKNRSQYTGPPVILENAAYAILFHNCQHEELKLDAASDFLAQLLCFIDYFQAWGRENHYETLFDGECFQKVVLRGFDLIKDPTCIDQMKLIMRVDYLPFRFVSPFDKVIEIKQNKLKDVMRKGFDRLSRMGLCIDNESKRKSWHNVNLDFTFCISGRAISL